LSKENKKKKRIDGKLEEKKTDSSSATRTTKGSEKKNFWHGNIEKEGIKKSEK